MMLPDPTFTSSPVAKPKHLCHAEGCTKPVKPQLLMCLKHWAMVPRALQIAVWKAYRHGQCDDMRPSRTYMEAAKAAIAAVAEKEGHRR